MNRNIIKPLMAAALAAVLIFPVGCAQELHSDIFTPQIEISRDIGAHFDPNYVHITYSSFAPVKSESEAVTTAVKWLTAGFHVPTDNLTVDTTVGLFSGHLARTDSNPDDRVVSNVPAWIVVIKDLPISLPIGPAPVQGSPVATTNVAAEYNVAVDATTGALLDAILTGN